MTITNTPPTVELYVRSLAPNGALRSQVERIQRLEELVEAGRIEDFDVRVVGRGVVHEACCTLTPTGQLLGDRLADVRAWVTENDATMPGVETTSVSESPLTDAAYTVTTIPENMLVEYQNDRILVISPATLGDTHFSVDDHLDALEGADDDLVALRNDCLPIKRSGAASEDSDRSDRTSTPVVLSVGEET